MVGFLVNNTLGDGFEAKTRRLFFLIHVGIEGVKHWDVIFFSCAPNGITKNAKV